MIFINLQKQVIYSVYVRAHTEEGTFLSLIPDLDRIKALGTDIIWFMPIHPIGVEGKKGSLGCPYANRDYRSVNPAYGTMEDFRILTEEIHRRGMKCMIDVVYNHTSPDAVLLQEHPEFYYRDENGNTGNKVGDWADVIDLDYSVPGLWDYQIESLCQWAKIVDGFRCDVASFVPVSFWNMARSFVEKVRPGCIWLGETVHQSFGNLVRREGFGCSRDTEAYEAFDMEYEYDIDISTGEIVGKSQEAEIIPAALPQQAASAAPQAAPAQSAAAPVDGEEAASQAALTHAGVNRNETMGLRVKTDWEFSGKIYEVEFHVGRTEYNYDIDADTFEILSWEVDTDD